MASLQTTSQELAHVTEQLKLKEEELQTLRNGKHFLCPQVPFSSISHAM